jgi:hypothetical protein
MDNGSSTAAAFSAFAVGYCVFLLVVIAFMIFIFWRIFKKTGQHGAMSLLTLIPGIGTIIVLCILAFGKWPIETEVEQQRMMQGGTVPPAPAPPGYPGYAQPQPPYSQYPTPPPQYPPQQYS